jgi:succinate-semialdehyde dehydrogenase/glutarate-semialdehyde dehydrogenase
MWLAEQMAIGMVAINRGVVSDPAAPFRRHAPERPGPRSHSATDPSGSSSTPSSPGAGGREGTEAYLETQYLSVDWPTDRPLA